MGEKEKRKNDECEEIPNSKLAHSLKYHILEPIFIMGFFVFTFPIMAVVFWSLGYLFSKLHMDTDFGLTLSVILTFLLSPVLSAFMNAYLFFESTKLVDFVVFKSKLKSD